MGSGETYDVAPSPGPCVFLVVGGGGEAAGETLARGSVVFASAGEAVKVAAGEGGCVMYRAMINSRVFA